MPADRLVGRRTSPTGQPIYSPNHPWRIPAKKALRLSVVLRVTRPTFTPLPRRKASSSSSPGCACRVALACTGTKAWVDRVSQNYGLERTSERARRQPVDWTWLVQRAVPTGSATQQAAGSRQQLTSQLVDMQRVAASERAAARRSAHLRLKLQDCVHGALDAVAIVPALHHLGQRGIGMHAGS